MSYTHHILVNFATSFKSDIEDIEEAFDKWLESFSSVDDGRRALLSTDESTRSIAEGVIFIGTDKSS